MKKYRYNIDNLDCANCAREIEEKLNKNKKFKNVVVNFNTSKISYESNENISIKELNELVKKVEPNASVTDNEVKQEKEYHLSILLIGVSIGLLANFLPVSNIIKTILFIVAYVLLLYRTTINAIKLLIKSKSINENALITISCIGALAIGNSMEGMMVIVLYTIGKILEEKAINNSRKSIKNLLDIKQPYANKKDKDKITKIEVEEIKLNDILVVKKGEKIPVDGIIVKGNTSLDTSALTGESELVYVQEKSSVLSGSINIGNVIEIKATSLFENSTVSKILELLEDATDKKTKTETTIAKISKVYTPVIIILAILIMIFLPLIMDISYKESLYRGLTFLVISCPCAIAISIPLSYFTGIGIASKNGILIKGSNYLDNLVHSNNIIFDKTGTLTEGKLEINEVQACDGYDKAEILKIACSIESKSKHPIAHTFVQYKKDHSLELEEVENFESIAGKGLKGDINGQTYFIGNKTLFSQDINLENNKMSTTVIIGTENEIYGLITLKDKIRDETPSTIASLNAKGIKTTMITGDNEATAKLVADEIGLSNYYADLLPQDKVNIVSNAVSKHHDVAMVGDGVNDTPSLARANVGIAMGLEGADVAIETADIVLLEDKLSKINLLVDLAKKTMGKIKFNVAFCLSVKVILMILGIAGYISLWEAVLIGDMGITLLVVGNSLLLAK